MSENRAPNPTLPLAAKERIKMQRANGAGRLVTQVHNNATRIDELYQEGCAKIRLPKTHTSALEAVLINTSGGLTGGDKLTWDINAVATSKLVLTTQACERIYKSSEGPANVETHIKVGKGAHVDWLPQETILFEHSSLNRTLKVDLEENASFTGVEAVLLGREAMGENARSAILSDNWRVHRNGKLIHAEANQLSASDVQRDALSTLAGNNAFATVIYIAENAEERLAEIRALIAPTAKAAVSAVGERLIVRALAPSGLALRRIITPIIEHLSGAGAVPRLWLT